MDGTLVSLQLVALVKNLGNVSTDINGKLGLPQELAGELDALVAPNLVLAKQILVGYT